MKLNISAREFLYLIRYQSSPLIYVVLMSIIAPKPFQEAIYQNPSDEIIGAILVLGLLIVLNIAGIWTGIQIKVKGVQGE